MALTAYQVQFKRRMKRAIRQRARADQKARRYTQLLADALLLSQDAAAQMNALNQLYNVDVSTQTILIHDLLDALQPDQLTGLLGQSIPGEEEQLFNQVPDGNGGQPLPENPLFGEAVTGPPVVVFNPPASMKPPGPAAPAISISQLRAQDVGSGNWTIVVQASAPSGEYHLVNDFAPYPYDFRNGDEMSFTFNEATAGQRVRFTFTDPANPQLREERTLTLG